jgi:hypothetical protein
MIVMMLLLGVSTPANADICVKELKEAPASLRQEGFTFSNTVPAHYVPQKLVSKEVAYLQKELPSISVTVYLIHQSDDFYGGTCWDNAIYLFAYPKVYSDQAYYSNELNQRTPAEIAHELGHYVRFNYLTMDDLHQYIAQRGITNEDRAAFRENYPWENINEETFAEDFRQLFGGPAAQASLYDDGIPKPTDKDREWILGHIPKGGENNS